MAMMRRCPFPDLRGLLLCGTALAAAAPALAQAPNARPQGGVVSAGSAAIAQDAARTQVNQATDRAVIDWRGFDVGRDHAVRFQQPNSSSMTLNRVNSADPSRIAGQVTANGGIAIVNQSGVIFAPGARVEAQSVIISTADIANQRFMAGGRMVFDRPGRADARIVNEGTITAREAGIAALVAPQVANRGVISARLGTVAIAGAETHVIDLYGDGLMSIEITGAVRQRPADGGALVSNDGTLQADGGRVSLTAAAADGIVQNLVRAGGRVSANTDATTGRRGEVVVAGTGGAVIIEGQVEARGLAAGQRGGTIEVVAERVLAAAGARIDASGAAGGGEIAFGQTRQGSATPRRAERTGVAAGAELRADATVLGQGGRIVLHSTDTTLMAGTISARGGPQGGDGGFVEVSGERGFRMFGVIDVSAPAGRDGTVLFDPENLRISNDPGSDTVVGTGDVADGILTFAEVPGNAVLATGEIADITGHLVLQATNSIIVENEIFKDGGLTLQTGSGGFIAINASINLPSGDLVLIAGTGGITQAAGAAISLSAGQLLVQSGGNVSLTAAGNIIPSLGPSSVTGNFTITASGCCSAPVVTLNGAITVSGTFDITAPGASIIQSDGSVITASRLNATATGGGSISLAGANQVTTLGDLTADSSIFFINATTLTVAGTLAINDPQFGQITVRVLGGDLVVNGNITLPGDLGNFDLSATGNVVVGASAVLTGGQETFGEGSSFNSIIAGYDPVTGFANPALPGGITLAGTIASDGLLYLGAGGGGVVQTGGSVTASSLAFDSAGALRLGSASNAIGSLVNVNLEEGSLGTAAIGDVVINNGASDLLVDSVLSGANINITTTGTLTVVGEPPPTAGGTAGLISAPNGRVSLLVGELSLPASAFGSGPRVVGAVVEIAPATSREMLVGVPDALEIVPPNAFILRNATLGLIEATNTYRFGGTTFDGVTTATASALSVLSPFTFSGTLDLRSLGTITQAADANLTVGALAGAAGGAVTLTNAGNSIGFLDDFLAGGGFTLTAGVINLRGLVSAPGQLVTLNSAGGIQSTGTGRIEAGELRAVAQAGSISLTGANQLDRLGESSTPGDFTLVNAGPQMTIPSGQTVQAAGTGSVTATAGSITVDGTIRAAELSLSAPAGTVTVNGFSAIAFAGGLTLSAQNVAVTGLIAGSTGIEVTATQTASLAGIAQTPDITITAPSITFGGLNASGSQVALVLGAGGTATGSLSAAALRVVDGAGATLTGSIAGNGTSAAAALGRRFAGETQLGDPPPDRFDYLFNGCPIGASSCAPPVPPVPSVPSVDIPIFTVADNPRGVMGELDPAGQPPANPLVQIPILPFVMQSGRDTSEDRELAPPNIRAEDF